MSRYSTAREGLKYAARIAASISALGKPILSISAMADSRCCPILSAEGSLKFAASAPEPAGAGEGVAGAFGAVPDAGAGAAGGAGVAVFSGAGVDGGLVEDEGAEGAGFGCYTSVIAAKLA